MTEPHPRNLDTELLLVDPPSGKTRWLVSGLIGIVIAIQLALPLKYYFDSDQTDERFAWRMFSSSFMRHKRCSNVMFEQVNSDDQTVRRVPIETLIPKIWRHSFGRFQRPILDKLLHWRCDQGGILRIRYGRVCPQIDGNQVESTQLELNCQTHEITLTKGLLP